MSHQWEHDIANGIYDCTGPDVRAYPCGYSGSNAMPQPDLLVTEPAQVYAIEAKGPIQSDHCYVEEEDVHQLVACENSYTSVHLAVKFRRREPLVLRYFGEVRGRGTEVVPDDYDEKSPAEKFAWLTPEPFDGRVTADGRLALTKPDTDDWPSAKTGLDDVEAVASGLGLVYES